MSEKCSFLSSKIQVPVSNLVAAEREEKESHGHEKLNSSAALPSTALLVTRQSAGAGRERAPCGQQTTRSCYRLFPNSQLSAVTTFPFDLGLFVFNIRRSFNLVALLFF